MTDILTPRQRHYNMSRIKGKDTKLELIIRKALFSYGFRYKLHDKKLPGKPDMVLPKYNAVIFINGCFWHGHNCHLFKWPSTRAEFWRKKISRNIEVDKRNYKLLKSDGWYILTIWECALKGKSRMPINIIIDEVVSWLENEFDYKVIKGKNINF